jgi:hypothetical protein
LLDHRGVPRQVVVDDVLAVSVEVDALGAHGGTNEHFGEQRRVDVGEGTLSCGLVRLAMDERHEVPSLSRVASSNANRALVGSSRSPLAALMSSRNTPIRWAMLSLSMEEAHQFRHGTRGHLSPATAVGFGAQPEARRRHVSVVDGEVPEMTCPPSPGLDGRREFMNLRLLGLGMGSVGDVDAALVKTCRVLARTSGVGPRGQPVGALDP